MSFKINNNNLKVLKVNNNFITSVKIANKDIIYVKNANPISSEYNNSGCSITGNNSFSIARNTTGTLVQKNILQSISFSFSYNGSDSGATATKFNDLTIQLINSLTNTVIETIVISRAFVYLKEHHGQITVSGLKNFTLGNSTTGFKYGGSGAPNAYSTMVISYNNSTKKLSLDITNSRAINGTYDLGDYNYANGPLYIKLYWTGGSATTNSINAWLTTNSIIGYPQR